MSTDYIANILYVRLKYQEIHLESQSSNIFDATASHVAVKIIKSTSEILRHIERINQQYENTVQ